MGIRMISICKLPERKKFKIKKNIYNAILFIILIIYSLLLTNQGVTVTDTGYNYGNFVNYDSLDNMWKFSTYLATALGSLFTRLPLGHSMLGLNIYTGLVKALIALVIFCVCVYYFNMKSSIVFLAELMALGYCWCPTALLYNYLSYLLFTVGAILLCVAVKSKKYLWYFLAGLCLGINVLVRLPNLAEMSLIFAVWYYCYISKRRLKDTLKITGLCIGGYVLGIGSILVYISFKYGMKEYWIGINEILTMPTEASSYSLGAMIRGDMFSYLANMKWLILALVFVGIGTLFYSIFKDNLLIIKKILYMCSNLLLLCIYKKMGMFKITYYNYESIEQVGILFLMISGILGLYVIFFGGTNYALRMHAFTMGIIILVTPLGSNNHLYSAINNLFWVTPFIFHCCCEWNVWAKKNISIRKFSWEPMRITFTILIIFVFIQGVLFGTQFVFRDGTNGEKRTARIADISALSGMYTQPQNANALNELNNFLIENKLKDKKVILYNNVPGLAFYMDLEPALSSTWPDLDSFAKMKFEQELQLISDKLQQMEKPLIILGAELDTNIPKQKLLQSFMEDNDYSLIYSNDLCYLYR